MDGSRRRRGLRRGHIPRAARFRYDLARRLQLADSLQLAAKIAASHGEDALTARVEDLVAAAAQRAQPAMPDAYPAARNFWLRECQALATRLRRA